MSRNDDAEQFGGVVDEFDGVEPAAPSDGETDTAIDMADAMGVDEPTDSDQDNDDGGDDLSEAEVTAELTGEETSDTVDWPELWQEFGFDTPNANDSIVISKTQLLAAIDCSDQNVTGSPAEHIQSALDDEIIREMVVPTPQETVATQGYVLEAMLE